MIADKPEFLKSGELARLIPVVADGSREKRITSVVLAVMTAVPAFARALLASAGKNIGKSAKLQCWTEVVLAGQEDVGKDRPDGMIVVSTGRSQWSALVEAKIGNQELVPEQVERYVQLAKAHGVDAVITISNQMVARADHHPIKLPKRLLHKVGLYHWSWMSVLTEAMLLDMGHAIEDSEQQFLLDETIRFLSHDSTGINGLGQMNKEWKDVVTTVRNGGTLAKTTPDVEATISSWHQEQRDLCLIMSRHLGAAVGLRLERKHKDAPQERLKDDCQVLASEMRMCAPLQIPNAAAELEVIVDLQTRTITSSMRLDAPKDKQQTKARVNWLLRQLAKTDNDQIHVRAKWPGRTPDTMESLATLREDATAIQASNPKLAPWAFEVLLVCDLAGKFSGTRSFVENLERVVPEFYDQVGQHLRAWRPAPPKPRAPEDAQVEASA
jgi:hypothetical protein